MKLNKIHHVAVICSDYELSKQFYTEVLGLNIVSENYREKRTRGRQTAGLATHTSWSCSPFPTLLHVLPIPKQPVCATSLSRWTISRQLSTNSTSRA